MNLNDAALPTADRAAETLALPSWQAELKTAVRDPAELERLLELPPGSLGVPAGLGFPLLVPRGFVARMRKGDSNDPLLRQVWPSAAERAETTSERPRSFTA